MSTTQTKNTIKQTIKSLFDDLEYLPELGEDQREQIFDTGREILTTSDKIIKSYIRVSRDNGSVTRVPAYRIQT
jgi:glutamate dehydrogenase (NAD(P)+)